MQMAGMAWCVVQGSRRSNQPQGGALVGMVGANRMVPGKGRTGGMGRRLAGTGDRGSSRADLMTGGSKGGAEARAQVGAGRQQVAGPGVDVAEAGVAGTQVGREVGSRVSRTGVAAGTWKEVRGREAVVAGNVGAPAGATVVIVIQGARRQQIGPMGLSRGEVKTGGLAGMVVGGT